jgi:hypothetical protein
MITVSELKEIFEDPEYIVDLSELSSYAESVMQERYMVLLLSKYLYRRHKIKLEKHLPLEQQLEQRDEQGKQKQGIHDLVVDGTKIEFKFHYDFDIHNYLRKELVRYEDRTATNDEFWEAVRTGKTTTWSITPGIYKDVGTKKADIFVWVICARNLNGVKEADLEFINQSDKQEKYNKRNGYGSAAFLKSVNPLLERLLERLKGLRQYSIEEVRISTTGSHFPSTYHLRLCKFERTH